MNSIRAISRMCLVGIVLLTGCSQRPPEKTPLTEAHRKFLKICGEQKVNLILKPLQHTAWVYVPLRENLVRLAATPEGPQKSENAQERPSVKYVDSAYENRRFVITYDIRPDKSYAQGQGTKMDYAPLYHQISRQIMTAISQAYFDAADAPAFFVVVIADVLDGVEIENVFYLEDLKRYMMFENIPQEEFVKRSLYEIRGKTEWTGDAAGRHLAYTEITMAEFLARQITNRVTFAYQKSAFVPASDTSRELLTIAATTLGYYEFKDFDGVRLRNLADNTEVIADPATLWTYQQH